MVLPHEEGQPVVALTAGVEGMLCFVNCMSVAEQINSGKGAVDAEPMKSHCSVSVMMPGGAKKPCMLPAVLLNGSGMSMVGERRFGEYKSRG